MHLSLPSYQGVQTMLWTCSGAAALMVPLPVA
jgi:hypothetical protein